MTNQSVQLIPLTTQPYNAETPLSALLEERTPLGLVYVRNHFETPRLEVADWSLSVSGSVDRPLELSYAEIRALPSKTMKVVLECAGNGRTLMDPVPGGTPWGLGAVSIVEFTGTSLVNVLDRAGIEAGAVEAVFEGADRGEVEPGRVEPFARSLPLDTALDPDILLAWNVNGRPLPAKHGFPLRLVVPGWYGMASVKWLERITLLPEPFGGFFQSDHYVYLEEGGTRGGEPVRHLRPRSLILDPVEGNALNVGQEVQVVGIAWSGGAPVAKVEFSPDGGANWWTAELERPSSPYGRQEWSYPWTAGERGSHRLVSRATDSRGDSQPTSQRWNRLGYGNNGPQQVVVTVN